MGKLILIKIEGDTPRNIHHKKIRRRLKDSFGGHS
jgi:hypothetical protein